MKKKIVVMVCLLCQRVDKKTGEYTVFGKLGKHTVTEKFFSDQHTDHDIIFAQSVNRMRAVGINQKYLIFFQKDRFSVYVLRTGTGINIIDFDMGMDMLRNRIESGISFD